MAVVTRYVNTGSTAGGDGTTNNTTGVTRAYATLSEWEAAEQTNLVSAGDTHIVYCAGSTADTTQLVLSGWTCGSGNECTVAQNSSDAHGGSYNTGVYRLEHSGSSLNAVDGYETYFKFIDLQIKNTNTGGGNPFILFLDANNEVQRCVLQSTTNTHSGIAFSNDCTFTDTTIEAIDGSGSRGAYRRSAGRTGVNFVNCTFDGYYYNCEGESGVTVTNVACIDRGTGGTDFQGTFNASSDYNCSEDTSAPGTNSIKSQTGTSLFTDPANSDFSLKTGSNAIDAGTTSALTTSDIIGTARPQNSVYDIGAFENISAGGGTILPLLNAYYG